MSWDTEGWRTATEEYHHNRPRSGSAMPDAPPRRHDDELGDDATPDAGRPLRRHRDGNAATPRHLIKNVIPETGVGLLSGQWGSYKTFVAINLCVAVVTGRPFAGEHRVKRPGGVLFIASEGQSHLERRVDAAAMDAGEDRPLPIFYLFDVPLLLDGKGLRQIIASAKDAAADMARDFNVDLVLIVIDTLSGAAGYAKANDENDAAVVGKLMAALRAISIATGAFTLAVDHFGKNADVGTRGSSNKEAPAETVLELLADKSLSGEVTNTRLALRKVRDGAAGREIVFTTKIVTLGVDEDGDPVTTLVVDWKPSAAPSAERAWPKSLQLLRRVIASTLADAGTDTAPFADGPIVRAVDAEIVRGEFSKQYLADGTPRQKSDARRKAFTRAMKGAQAKNLVVTRELDGRQLIWLASAADEAP